MNILYQYFKRISQFFLQLVLLPWLKYLQNLCAGLHLSREILSFYRVLIYARGEIESMKPVNHNYNLIGTYFISHLSTWSALAGNSRDRKENGIYDDKLKEEMERSWVQWGGDVLQQRVKKNNASSAAVTPNQQFPPLHCHPACRALPRPVVGDGSNVGGCPRRHYYYHDDHHSDHCSLGNCEWCAINSLIELII